MHAWSLLAGLALAGCGTYSMVRPAQTLPRGRVELAAGVAASGLEANTIAHLAVGVAERVEVLAQNEIWNTFGEVRFALLRPSDSPVSLVVGAGGGYAITLLAALTEGGDHDTVNGAAGTVSVSAGHDFGRVALALANRTFFLSAGYVASSTRASMRVRVAGRFGLFVEGGATVHAPIDALGVAFAIGEGAAGLYLGF